MKKSIIAVLLAILMLLPLATVAGKAITVEKDGREYILNSHTPTTGDVNVLMIRIGFADYPVDDEEYPADSEETLLNYFDGTQGSVNGYYETSSYGKLRLHCDKVYTYNAKLERIEYDDYYSYLYGIDYLMREAFTALEEEISFDDYDSDGDGYLDFVAFDYAGPNGDWGTTWWPHVDAASDFEVGGKRLHSYSFLKGKASVFIHEFGHILGATDYYCTDGTSRNGIMTYDIMSNNTGDHDGFTKWSYGWLDDSSIVYADRTTGDMTVTLTPIETPDSGKKIAVVAPTLDRSNTFLDEYFLVEYDSGEGNNADVFREYGFAPGFRIFHVNAQSTYFDGEPIVRFNKNNVMLRDNLIHNVRNEMDDPGMWQISEMFFREGDSLTPQNNPNTGLWDDDVYNGLYTGISFTDFVTGDEPSFRVSFSDDPPPEVQVNLTLEYDELKSDAQITVKSDKAVNVRTLISPEENEKYAPYLLDNNGTRFLLSADSAQDDVYFCSLGYQNADPTLQPNTEYTFVIPEGFLKTGYNQDVPEFRQKVTTADFLPLNVIATEVGQNKKMIQSDLFTVTDQTFGVIRLPRYEEGDFVFTEYNLNGEKVSELAFDIPGYDRETDRPYRLDVKQLNDGNFALIINSYENAIYTKIDRRGNIISDVYKASIDLFSDYVDYIWAIDYNLYHNGLCALITSRNDETAMLVVDFESQPTLTETDSNYYYYSLDSNTHMIERFYDHANHLLVYGANDTLLSEIRIESGFLCAFNENGNITVVNDKFDNSTGENTIYATTYTKSGELIEKKDITAHAREIYYYGVFDHCHANSGGYYLETDDPEQRVIVVYDKDWNLRGSFSMDNNTSYTFVENCGIIRKTQYDVEFGEVDIISRFQLGDAKIAPVRLLGDANLDGAVDITDATTVQRYDVLMTELNETALWLADVDRNGQADIMDVTWLQRFEVGLKAPIGIGKPIAV